MSHKTARYTVCMSPVISFSLLLSAEGGIEHHHDDKSPNNSYGGLAVIAAR